MDALDRLELEVNRLLARLDELKAEASALREELSGLKQENIELAAANRALKDAQLRADALRMEALRRLEALLRRIREYGGAEQE